MKKCILYSLDVLDETSASFKDGYAYHACILTYSIGRKEALEQSITLAVGWEDGEYMTSDGGHFWDAGNIYDQGRRDVADEICLRLLKP